MADIIRQMDEWADMDLLAEYVQRGSDEAFAALVTRYVHPQLQDTSGLLRGQRRLAGNHGGAW
jgi:hypothetical protein